jgi:molecular chaperone GrpE
VSSHNKRNHPDDPEASFSRGNENAGAEESSDSAAESNAGEGLDAFGEQLNKLVAEKQELTNMLVRRQADFENYRKRVEKERHQERHRGVEALIESILPVLDAFDRALDTAGDSAASAEYLKGFEMIRRQFGDLLAKQGLKRIESVGKEFNPHLHHAIERVETHQHPDGFVIGEMQPGYTFHEKVLRPAMVRVASEPSGKSIPVTRGDH